MRVTAIGARQAAVWAEAEGPVGSGGATAVVEAPCAILRAFRRT